MSLSSQPVAPRPGRAARAAYAICLAIDGVAVLTLAWLIYDAATSYGMIEGDAVLCTFLLVLVTAFAAGAVAAYRRRLTALAIVLAALPAVPSVAFAAALAVFIATFTHQR